MDENALEELLRRWGRMYGEGAPNDDGDDVGFASMVGAGTAHPLAVAMEYAPGRRGIRTLDVAYRRMVRPGEKAWSRDPVRCTETKHYAGALYFSGAETGRVEPEVSRVEKAALDLYRVSTIRGLVLRAQYCKRGSQQDKTDWINAQGRGSVLKLRMYREELAHARTWMQGRLSA